MCTRAFHDIQYQYFRWLKVLSGASSWVRVSRPICCSLFVWVGLWGVTHAPVCVQLRACMYCITCASVCVIARCCSRISVSDNTKELPLETPAHGPGMKLQRWEMSLIGCLSGQIVDNYKAIMDMWYCEVICVHPFLYFFSFSARSLEFTHASCYVPEKISALKIQV